MSEPDAWPPVDSTEDLPLGDIENVVERSPFLDVTYEEPSTGTPPISDNIEEGGVFDDATTTIGDGACNVCGAPVFRPPGLTKTGRKKRVPKYCDLHNPNVRVHQYDGPSMAGMESQLKRIQDELADDIRLLGTLSGPFYPVTGYYIFDNADPFTTAVLKLCKNNTQLLRILHRAAQVAPVYEVAKTAAGVAVALQVDQKKTDPHSGASRRLGVEQAYYAVYPDQFPQQPTNGSTPSPPKYSVVG